MSKMCATLDHSIYKKKWFCLKNPAISNIYGLYLHVKRMFF